MSADIIILTETLAVNAPSIPGLYHASCSAIKSPKPGRPSGGVSIFYNHRVTQAQTLLAEDDCVVLGSKSAYYCGIYVRQHPVETTDDIYLYLLSYQCVLSDICLSSGCLSSVCLTSVCGLNSWTARKRRHICGYEPAGPGLPVRYQGRDLWTTSAAFWRLKQRYLRSPPYTGPKARERNSPTEAYLQAAPSARGDGSYSPTTNWKSRRTGRDF